MAAAAAEGIGHHSVEGRFSIRFPAEPHAERETLTTKAGRIQMNSERAQMGGCGFFVSWYDASKSKQPEVDLRNAQAGSIARVHGTLLAEKEIELDGVPGRQWSVEMDRGRGRILARAYHTGTRRYTLMGICPAAQFDSAAVQAFLDSFQIDTR